MVYQVAYDKVGVLYHEGFISGKLAGSFVHWIIKIVVFVAIWAVTYEVFWFGKFVMTDKIQITIGICSIVSVAIAAKLFIGIKGRNELVKNSVKVEDNDSR